MTLFDRPALAVVVVPFHTNPVRLVNRIKCRFTIYADSAIGTYRHGFSAHAFGLFVGDNTTGTQHRISIGWMARFQF
jgi:hypothetical protein